MTHDPKLVDVVAQAMMMGQARIAEPSLELGYWKRRACTALDAIDASGTYLVVPTIETEAMWRQEKWSNKLHACLAERRGDAE